MLLQEIRDDVVEECNKHGGVSHIYVDKASAQGNVYVKCPNVNTAVAAVNALHGRWFAGKNTVQQTNRPPNSSFWVLLSSLIDGCVAGKVITAAYVPVVNYHNLFPDSANGGPLIQLRR